MASCGRRFGAHPLTARTSAARAALSLLTAATLASSTAAAAEPSTAPSPAPNAEVTAYCAKVRARAAADAALLIAPTLRAEAIKLPPSLQSSGRVDPVLGGAEYQGRAAVQVSPLRAYKGFKVMDAAEHDCAQQSAATQARDLATDAMETARLAALEKQAAFLASKRPEWEAIAARMQERFAARTVTLVDVDDVNAVTEQLARQQIQLAGEIAKLRASTASGAARPKVAALRSQVAKSSRRFEESASHIRSLDAWDFTVTAGVVPPIFAGNASTGVYGVAVLSYDLGGPWHTAAEGRYLDARDQEIRAARSSVLKQLDTMLAVARAVRTQVEGELGVLDRRKTAVTKSRATVEDSESSAAFRQIAVFDLALLEIESERVFLKELAVELAHLEEN